MHYQIGILIPAMIFGISEFFPFLKWGITLFQLAIYMDVSRINNWYFTGRKNK
jgi:hypothetical protein